MIKVCYLVELCLKFLFPVSFHEVQELGLDGRGQSQNSFWTGDEVEGHRERPSLLKVGDPKFCPSKLPLNVSIVLQDRRNQKEENG